MTWHQIRYACGHSDRLTLTGNASSRKWQASKEAERKCEACWAKAAAADRAAEAVAAAGWAAELELPALTGSDKQITWAETLRKNLLARADQELETARALHAKVESDDPLEQRARWSERVTTLEGIGGALRGVTAARWWIDHRDVFLLTYLVSSKALRITTPDHVVAGFLPMGDNTLDVSADDIVEHRTKSIRIALRNSRWEGCTYIHPRSMLTMHDDVSVTIKLPGDWKTSVTDDRRSVVVTAGELFLDRTTQRLDAPGAPFVVPNVWMRNDWNSFDVPTADVTRDPDALSVTVALTCSVWEGLQFTHPATLVTDHADGTSTVRFSEDWTFKVLGGEKTLEVAPAEMWKDRTAPLDEPGPSQAVEQRAWSQVEFHPDRVKLTKPVKGQVRSVYVRAPWDSETPAARIFHPLRMTATRWVEEHDWDELDDDVPVTTRRQERTKHVWRFHDEWTFTVKDGASDTDLSLTGAEFAELVAPWAANDPAHDPKEYTPDLLPPVEHVFVPDDLIYERNAA